MTDLYTAGAALRLRPYSDAVLDPPEPSVLCEVWIADIAWLRPEHEALLDRAEVQRQQLLRRSADRARFVTAAALLRLVVAAKEHTDPRDLTVDRSCDRCGRPHGKPRITGSNLHVSLSHSGDMVALAVTRAAPVGIDVEEKIVRDLSGLIRTVVSPREVVDRPEQLYSYWCRKEAVVKATGAGMRVPLIEVVVSAADEPARLISYRGAPLECAMLDLDCGPGYAAAVAVLARGRLDIRRRDAGPVLAGTPVSGLVHNGVESAVDDAGVADGCGGRSATSGASSAQVTAR